ncbi:hypothetical protein GCM10020216_014000 [Nonomuraea helvata]
MRITTVASAAYGVYATIGTHGQSGSNPLSRTTAHAANGATTIQLTHVRMPCITMKPALGS